MSTYANREQELAAQRDELQQRVDELETEAARKDRLLSTARDVKQDLEMEVDRLVDEMRHLNINLDLERRRAEDAEDRARRAERELEDMRNRVRGW